MKKRQVRQPNGQIAWVFDAPKPEPRGTYIYPPCFGELGWVIVGHARHVHNHAAKVKVVCCTRDEIGLYPSGTYFWHQFVDPMPGDEQKGIKDWYVEDQRKMIAADAQCAFPGSLIQDIPTCVVADQNIKFVPTLFSGDLQQCEVVLCCRKRVHVPERNWNHWNWLSNSIMIRTLKTVGIIGQRETSADVSACEYGWMHPIGPLSGAIEMLSHCKLYIGTDTGPTHLAALMNIPILMFSKNVNTRMTGLIHQATRGPITELPDSAWDDRNMVLDAALKLLEARC